MAKVPTQPAVTTLDWDAFWGKRRTKIEPVIFGKRYTNIKEIPFMLGMRLDAMREEADLVGLFRESIDWIFGEGAFQHMVDQGVTTEEISELLAWARTGFSPTYMDALEKADDYIKNGKVLSEETSISESTGVPSTPTSDENTASTLPGQAT